jgi:hypothetical protein
VLARPSKKSPRKAVARVAAKPALLAGGNPQITKADGDAPVQAYIAAMPGWKRDVGRRLDAQLRGSGMRPPCLAGGRPEVRFRTSTANVAAVASLSRAPAPPDAFADLG